MKRRYYILGGVILLCIVFYYIDDAVFMKKRVLRHKWWDYESGKIYDKNQHITRGTLYTGDITFKKDTMIFDYGKYGKDTLVLKWEYFNTMKVIDPKTKKYGKYSMKGSNWTNYLFK